METRGRYMGLGNRLVTADMMSPHNLPPYPADPYKSFPRCYATNIDRRRYMAGYPVPCNTSSQYHTVGKVLTPDASNKVPNCHARYVPNQFDYRTEVRPPSRASSMTHVHNLKISRTVTGQESGVYGSSHCISRTSSTLPKPGTTRRTTLPKRRRRKRKAAAVVNRTERNRDGSCESVYSSCSSSDSCDSDNDGHNTPLLTPSSPGRVTRVEMPPSSTEGLPQKPNVESIDTERLSPPADNENTSESPSPDPEYSDAEVSGSLPSVNKIWLPQSTYEDR